MLASVMGSVAALAQNTGCVPFHPVCVLGANDGYRVGVSGNGSAVVLEVVHGRSRAMTAYVARGTVTPRRLEASFGSFGKVAMRFRPSAWSECRHSTSVPHAM